MSLIIGFLWCGVVLYTAVMMGVIDWGKEGHYNSPFLIGLLWLPLLVLRILIWLPRGIPKFSSYLSKAVWHGLTHTVPKHTVGFFSRDLPKLLRPQHLSR